MANEEHVAILKKGVVAWNAWRDENPDIHPDLIEATLDGADLTRANLIETDFSGADLTGCHIYGVSAWRLKLEGVKQQNLVITRTDEPAITLDNIEVAQFIYLMLHNQKVHDVIDTITSKVVLILGRFTDERKAVLDALREELRKRNYLPILLWEARLPRLYESVKHSILRAVWLRTGWKDRDWSPSASGDRNIREHDNAG